MADAPTAPGPRPEGNRAQGLGRRMAAMPGGNRFWIILLVLLAVNYIIASQASNGPFRLQVPYSFFREEVGAGNVAEVTSTGDTIEGDFKKETAPPKGVDGSPSTHFKTERPAFADDGLIDLLLQKNVVINAHPIDEGQPLWQTLLFGFGPTILLVGLFVLLMRRAQGAAGGALGGFGRSRAKRYDAAAARSPDGVQLVDEDDRRSGLLGLVEEVAHAARADPDDGLDELRRGEREERHAGLAGDGPGEEGLPGAGRPSAQPRSRGFADRLRPCRPCWRRSPGGRRPRPGARHGCAPRG